jgi:hypothetical protein
MPDAWVISEAHLWVCLWGHFQGQLTKGGKMCPECGWHHLIDWALDGAKGEEGECLIDSVPSLFAFWSWGKGAALLYSCYHPHTHPLPCPIIFWFAQSNGDRWPWTATSETLSQNKINPSSLKLLSLVSGQKEEKLTNAIAKLIVPNTSDAFYMLGTVSRT